MLSIPHMIVVFIVVLVVFGPQKLPELARGLGKLMAEFRKASLDFKTAFEEEMRDLERQAMIAERKKAAEAASASATAQPAQQASPPDSASGEISTTASGSSPEAQADADPVIASVAEAVPRGSEDASEAKAEPATPSLQESPYDTQHPS